MRRSNVALRLQASLREEARRVSESEGVALHQFINVAVAEKLSALADRGVYFRERAARGDVAKVKGLLKRAARKPSGSGRRTGLTRAARNRSGSITIQSGLTTITCSTGQSTQRYRCRRRPDDATLGRIFGEELPSVLVLAE